MSAVPYATPYETTQGVALFFQNATVSPAVVATVATMMGVDSLSGDATSIDITNFSSPGFKEYAKGLVDPGKPSGDIVYQFTSAAQQALETYLVTGQGATTQWYLGAADGTSPPTITTGILTPPLSGSNATRSGFYWYGFVASMTKSIPVNSFIKAKLTIQASGRIWEIVKGSPLPWV